MALSLQLPSHTIIAAVNELIEKDELQSKKSAGKRLIMDAVQRKIGERESSLCQFVYAYLMHLQPLMKSGEGGTDDKKHGKLDLYKETIMFVTSLQWSRHPITICWLLEILHILTNKFPSPNLMSNSTLQKKLEKLFTQVLKSAECIIKNEANLDFQNNDYCLFDLHLSPTIYEMLKRFEFIQAKSGPLIQSPELIIEPEVSSYDNGKYAMQRFEEGTGEEEPAMRSNCNYNLLFSNT